MPLVILATVATIIASQAVISGAFSVTRQAIRLGFLPRIAIRHTSPSEFGQVYVPAVNWGLLVAVLALVIGFGSSAKLAAAYGVAVTVTITVDTVLFLVVAATLWRKPRWLVALGAVVFLTVDLAFLGANVDQARSTAAGSRSRSGRDLRRAQHLEARQRGARALADRARGDAAAASSRRCGRWRRPRERPPGAVVYLNPRIETTPLALRAALERASRWPRA